MQRDQSVAEVERHLGVSTQASSLFQPAGFPPPWIPLPPLTSFISCPGAVFCFGGANTGKKISVCQFWDKNAFFPLHGGGAFLLFRFLDSQFDRSAKDIFPTCELTFAGDRQGLWLIPPSAQPEACAVRAGLPLLPCGHCCASELAVPHPNPGQTPAAAQLLR